jgi:hypothetical protein
MGCVVDGSTMPCEIVGKFIIKFAARVQVIGAGVKIPIYVWVLNPDEKPGDACKDGVCPPDGVTVHDTGGHFEIAGYNIFSNTPAMRSMLPLNFGKTPLTQGEIDQLRKDVASLLADDTCAKFISAFFKQLSSDTGKQTYSTNAMDIFNAVEKQGGFSRRAGPFSATGGSTVGNGNADIDINFPVSSSVMGGAMHGRVILHELGHVGSGTNRDYDHYEMARAAYAVAQAQGFKGLGNKPPDGDHSKLDGASSSIFNDILFKACHVK